MNQTPYIYTYTYTVGYSDLAHFSPRDMRIVPKCANWLPNYGYILFFYIGLQEIDAKIKDGVMLCSLQ